LRQYSNAPSRSENVSQDFVDLELGNRFIAHLGISRINDLELDDPSIARVEISGLDVDSELDGLSVARVETSGSDVESELDGISVARVEFSGLGVESE
jgi:hypothetical protein